MRFHVFLFFKDVDHELIYFPKFYVLVHRTTYDVRYNHFMDGLLIQIRVCVPTHGSAVFALAHTYAHLHAYKTP